MQATCIMYCKPYKEVFFQSVVEAIPLLIVRCRVGKRQIQTVDMKFSTVAIILNCFITLLKHFCVIYPFSFRLKFGVSPIYLKVVY